MKEYNKPIIEEEKIEIEDIIAASSYDVNECDWDENIWDMFN